VSELKKGFGSVFFEKALLCFSKIVNTCWPVWVKTPGKNRLKLFSSTILSLDLLSLIINRNTNFKGQCTCWLSAIQVWVVWWPAQTSSRWETSDCCQRRHFRLFATDQWRHRRHHRISRFPRRRYFDWLLEVKRQSRNPIVKLACFEVESKDLEAAEQFSESRKIGQPILWRCGLFLVSIWNSYLSSYLG